MIVDLQRLVLKGPRGHHFWRLRNPILTGDCEQIGLCRVPIWEPIHDRRNVLAALFALTVNDALVQTDLTCFIGKPRKDSTAFFGLCFPPGTDIHQ